MFQYSIPLSDLNIVVINKAKQNKELNRKLTQEEWQEIENYIEKLGFKNGFIQELGEHEEEYVPKWDV